MILSISIHDNNLTISFANQLIYTHDEDGDDLRQLNILSPHKSVLNSATKAYTQSWSSEPNQHDRDDDDLLRFSLSPEIYLSTVIVIIQRYLFSVYIVCIPENPHLSEKLVSRTPYRLEVSELGDI